MSSSILGAGLALISAVLYGTGDFTGGAASRRSHSFQVLFLSSLSSIIFALLILIFRPESFLSLHDLLFSAAAGFLGAIGLSFLYRGLSYGSAAVIAPTSGVVSAAFPALVGIFIDDMPDTVTLIGFLIAFCGIWLVTRSKDGKNHHPRQSLLLGFIAGLGFGSYYILIAQVSSSNLLMPLLMVKIAALLAAAILLLVNRISLPRIVGNGLALLAGIFDFSANGFYFVATQLTRMDVAAVLSSLFPAATVFLSVTILKEKISRGQWIGVVLCIIAIALIVL